MTENIAVPAAPVKSRRKIVWIVLPVLFLLLVYGTGIAILPGRITTSFQARNCDSVLSLHGFYASVYPAFLQDAGLSAQVQECEAYALAVTSEETEKWQEAFDAYQTYANKYPNGIYARDAYERSAAVLINVVRGQAGQQQYADALKNLDLIITGFSDTKASADAWILVPDVYTAWGSSLRDSGDFEEAESVFTDFKSWSEQHESTDTVSDANRELTSTYIAWGQALLSEQQFESAIAKFELARAIDLEPASHSEPAARKAYTEWGNYLLEQKDFAGAIQKFDLAVSGANGSNDDGVKDALSNGYVQWAKDLRDNEDFAGALEKLEKAHEAAIADGMKESVETTFGETYLAFSNSSGSQAQRAMEDASKAVCKENEKPELPIFGLNKDVVRVAVYGVQIVLPETVGAQTSGEMHYVACITEEQKIIESTIHWRRVSSLVGVNYDVLGATFLNFLWVGKRESRVRLVWNVHLVDMTTLEEVATIEIEGSQPGPFSKGFNNVGTGVIFGKPPQIDLFLKWLAETLARVG